MADHEGHLLGGYGLGGDDEVCFVFAAGVVNDYDELAISWGWEGGLLAFGVVVRGSGSCGTYGMPRQSRGCCRIATSRFLRETYFGLVVIWVRDVAAFSPSANGDLGFYLVSKLNIVATRSKIWNGTKGPRRRVRK